MPVYFDYALKVSICLAVIFIFYTVLLKQSTYYTCNRYYLLLFSILSFIAPFINIGLLVQAHRLSAVSFVDQIPSINSSIETVQSVNDETGFTTWQILSFTFLLVSFMLVVRLAIQLLSIRKLRSKATLLAEGEVKIYHLSHPVRPFSFMNSIFINTNNYSANELPEIIDHERVHVVQNHTIDVLLTEIICILNWYNPFAWLIKKAVRDNLEFIADDAVISRGVDKKSYQYLLLKVTGDIPSSIASSLKFSSLKNRITMMNKTKTTKFHLLKFALLVPMVMLLLLAFRNRNDIQPAATELSPAAENYILSSLTYAIPNEKVKAIVINENDKSLLRTGEILNLTMIRKEKDRLKDLLERNGYTKLNSNAIGFMIDTASVNNSFSIEVKINVEPVSVSGSRKTVSYNNTIIPSKDKGAGSIGKENIKVKPYIPIIADTRINSYLNSGKTTPGC